MRPNRNQGDADLSVYRNLPAAASVTVLFPLIEIGKVSEFAVLSVGVTARVDVPALNATQLPDGSTLTVTISESDEIGYPALPDTRPFLVSATIIGTLVITGAGGMGAPAQSLLVPMRDNKRYVGAAMESGDTTGDQSDAPWAYFRVVT
jgi:hypothetical protein